MYAFRHPILLLIWNAWSQFMGMCAWENRTQQICEQHVFLLCCVHAWRVCAVHTIGTLYCCAMQGVCTHCTHVNKCSFFIVCVQAMAQLNPPNHTQHAQHAQHAQQHGLQGSGKGAAMGQAPVLC